ncbi:MAG: ribonuclease, partial [Bacteroidales bacterium]
ALKAGVKKLVIGHFSARYENAEVLLGEARAVFPETYLAADGLKFQI